MLPFFALHSAVHHWILNARAPFYQAFDTFTKHCWVARMTALATQVLVLPISGFMGAETFCMNVLGMYILHDMVHCAFYERNRMTWIHHIVTFAGYIYSFWATPDVFHRMVIGVLILESTSPFIQLCWLANKSKNTANRWFPVLAGWTLAFYFAVRCLYFPYYIVYSTPMVMWPLGAIFTIMNWIWMHQLVGYARAVLRNSGIERLE